MNPTTSDIMVNPPNPCTAYVEFGSGNGYVLKSVIKVSRHLVCSFLYYPGLAVAPTSSPERPLVRILVQAPRHLANPPTLRITGILNNGSTFSNPYRYSGGRLSSATYCCKIWILWRRVQESPDGWCQTPWFTVWGRTHDHNLGYSAGSLSELGGYRRHIDHRISYVAAVYFPRDSILTEVILLGANAFDNEPWIVTLVEFTRKILEEQTRVRAIGVCFGHQIIGRALGAKLGRNKRGWEASVTPIPLSGKGRELFGGKDVLVFLAGNYRKLLRTFTDK